MNERVHVWKEYIQGETPLTFLSWCGERCELKEESWGVPTIHALSEATFLGCLESIVLASASRQKLYRRSQVQATKRIRDLKKEEGTF